MRETTYKIANKGLATSFTESELPIEYASEMKNCFISQAGGAEERQGIAELITIPGGITITGLHELVTPDGGSIQFASGSGNIWNFDDSAQTSTLVYTFPTTTARVQHVVMSDRIIFYNGIDQNVYTKDGVTFTQLEAIIELGATTTGTSAGAFRDADIVNFVLNTNIAVNDLVFNVTLSAYGVVTSITSAEVRHTIISSAAVGLGRSDVRDQQSTDRYRVLDMTELNIIPTSDPNFLDNTGTADSGTSASRVVVGNVDFSTTAIRPGDYIYNVTRAGVGRVTSVSANVIMTPVTGQVINDTLIFLKPAMPITLKAHVHFGRLYCLDARDRTIIRFSGPDDPTNFTDGSGSIQLSDLQPTGEFLRTMTSFQKYLIFGGSKNAYFYQGTDPTDDANFTPLGLMPQGLVSQYGLVTIGNEALFVSQNGVQSTSLIRYATQLGRAPVSSQINTTLRGDIQASSEEEIIAVHYPRRSWVLFKIGSVMYCLNYQPNLATQKNDPNQQESTEQGSWSVFDGKFAQASCFFVRNDGDLLCGHNGGLISKFDANTYDDLGDNVNFVYKTGWLTTSDPKINVKQKQGVYIKPLFEVGDFITGTISVDAPFEGWSSDTADFEAGADAAPIGLFTIGTSHVGGSGVVNEKLPLYWKGEVFRLTFETSDTKGPFVLSRYTVYSNELGRI